MSDLEPSVQALWALQHLVPGKGVSNKAVRIELDHAVRWWPLQEALNWLVDRHSAVRSSFPVVDGAPVRRVLGPGQVRAVIDMHHSGEDHIVDDLRQFAAHPFDLAVAPLIRVGVFATGPAKHVVCVVVHHIIVDATSVDTLVAELTDAYGSLCETSAPPPLPPAQAAPVPEPDPAALDYWRARVAGFDPAGMRLEEARTPGNGAPSFSGELLETYLSHPAVAALTSLRERCRTTEAAVLLAAYLTTLRGHGAAEDALVGVMTDTRAGRGGAAVGFHVVTMPLRVRVAGETTFAELAAAVARGVVDGLDHGVVSFEVLAQENDTFDPDDPQWWRHRLVRHLFNFRPGRAAEQPLGPGSALREVDTGLSRFDLELNAEWFGARVVLKLLYSTELHDGAFARRFLDRLDLVLRTAAARPDLPLAELDLRTDHDRRVVTEANATAGSWPPPHTVPGMAFAAGEPDAVAVTCDGRPTTYAQLWAAAAAVRTAVRGHGGGVVAIAAPRGAGVVAAVLGVWSAGASYLPMDPDHPAALLAHQLDDAGCDLVLGGADLPESVRAGRACLPVPDPSTMTGVVEAPPEPAPDSDAYLIFTSGSTGLPKGVRITHRNLANVVRHFAADLALGPSAAVAWLTTFAFDISALELCLPLAVGGRLVVASDAMRASPGPLLDLVERESVTMVQATPTTWRLLAPVAAGRLRDRVVLCGGEPLTGPLAEALLATGARVYNVYGPTETTIWSTSAALSDPDAPITVGRPIANTFVDVLDERGRPRPIGLAGELCIGGHGVTPGYLHRPELTADRFRTGAMGRYYRTGDRARWLPDGTLDLLGRDDRQVKLRAHRIELGAVDAVVQAHPAVSAAAVVLHGDPSADGMLVAFVEAQPRPGLDRELWHHAARVLPGYSVPSRFVVLDALPHTGSGKVDHRALSKLAECVDDVPQPAGAPADGLEADLVALWRQVLRRPSLGRDANFFLSGGTSLLAVRLAERAAVQCGTTVTMVMVFRAPTPAAMAALVRAEQAR
ncbi:non-ribosomal peptide synthetase [Actinophytocola sp.]|uniref:non-ribosomal peptide synthetase n=1 Tax=Actinophytocola sp. TaxID=1872138 RepID=UPI003899FD25